MSKRVENRFGRGEVVRIRKSCASGYAKRPMHTPGVIEGVFYSVQEARIVYEVRFTGDPKLEFIRETDLEPRTEARVGKKIVAVCDECGLRLGEGEPEPHSHQLTSHMMRDVDCG